MKHTLKSQHWFLPPALLCAFSLAGLALSPGKALGADHFVYNPSSGATSFTVGTSISYTVKAETTGNVVDATVNDAVTVGLYDTTTGLLSDAAATIVSGGVTYLGGTAALAFSSGSLSFTIYFESGSNSEQVSIGDANITSGSTYPGTIGNPSGPGYVVVGYIVPYYAALAGSSPVSYFYPGGPNDNLLINDSPLTISNKILMVSNGASVSVADCFAVTNVSGGYAYGNSGILPYLTLAQSNLDPAATVNEMVIIHYSSAAFDYNNPSTSDTVYQGSVTLFADGSVDNYSTPLTATSGYAPFQNVINSGQIVFRIWVSNSTSTPVTMYYASASGLTDLTYIEVPYSQQNALPVAASFAGPTPTPVILPDGAVTTVQYVINNQYSSPVSFIEFSVPAGWSLSNVTSPSPFVSSIVSTPTASAPGTVSMNSAGNPPLATNSSVTVTLSVTAASTTANNWSFPLIEALTSIGSIAPLSYGQAVIQTLGIPPTPTPVTSAPVSFAAPGTGGAVSLSWGQVTAQGADGYILSRRSPTGSGAFTAFATIGSNATTSYIDATVANLTSYDYTVEAINAILQSAPVTVLDVVPYVNPGAPTAPQALTGGTTVQLSWTAPVSVSGSYAVTGYQIWRGTSSGGEVFLANTASSPYQDTTVAAGTEYYYKVTSLDGQYAGPAGANNPHESGFSPEVTGDPTGWPPTGLTSTLVSPPPSPQIGLSWTAPSSSLLLNAPITEYIIYKAQSPGAPVSYTSVSGSTTSYTDSTGLVQGNSYNYEVLAVDNKGVTSNLSNEVNQSVGPSAPTGLSASPSSTGVTLNWTANPASQSVTEYLVYQNGVSIGNSTTNTFTVPAATAVQGQNDGYQLAAVNNFSSPVTSPLSATVSSALNPVAETGLSVTITGASLNNTAVSWATLLPGNSNAVSYLLFRNTTNSLPGSPLATLAVTVAGSPVTSYLDTTSLTAGQIYYYFLEAENLYGTGPATMQALMIPPTAPVTAASSSNATNITVNWNALPGSQNVAYYTVYQTTLPGGTPVSIATVNVPTTTYTVSTGLVQGVTYVYNLTATNLGSGATIVGGQSLPSNSITLGLAPLPPTGLAVTAINSSNDIYLSWPNVLTEDPNATALSIYVNNVNNSSTASQTILAPAATTEEDQGIFVGGSAGEAPDTVYYYWLSANNTFGASNLDGPVSQLTYPASVTILSVAVAPDGVSRVINWGTVGSGDVTQYVVYRQLQGAAQAVTVGTFSATGLTLPVTITTAIEGGQIYDYFVTAVNATGQGSSATTIAYGTAPSVPVSLTAVSGISSAVTQVDLSWSDPSTVAQNVTGYTVYRSTSVTGPYAAVSPAGGVTATTTVYDDGTVAGATVYYYLVEADSSDGKESISNTTNAVAVTAYALPNVPTGLTETDGNAQASFVWTAPAATTYPIAGYNLYDSANGGATVKANATPIPATSGTLTGLSNGAAYDFFVQTVDSQGHLSALSAAVTGEPVAPPGSPGNVGLANGNEADQLTWTAATAGTLPIGGYLIYVSQAGSGVTTLAGQVGSSATGYIDTGLTNGVTYNFWVQAVDSTGVTTGVHASGLVGPLMGIPGLYVNPPGNLSAIGSPGSVAVTWTTSFTGLGAPVTGYIINRSTSASGGYSALVTVGSVENYADAAVTNGTTYYYYFNAYASGTASSASATVFATPALAPNPPTAITETDGNTKVTLDWTASAELDNVPISGYVVYRNGTAAATVFGSAVTTYADTGLANGTAYSYTLAAFNMNGTLGTQSGIINGYPYSLAAPTGLTTSSSAAAVTLTAWTPPASTYSISDYQVLRGVVSGGEEPLTVAGLPLTVAAAPATDMAVTLGQVYYYEVEAIDSKGHVGPPSNEVIDAPCNPINAPAAVSIVGGNGEVLVDWSAPVSAPGSLPVSEYIVTPINGSPGTAVTVTAANPWTLETGLTNPEAVSFTVQSVDITGQMTGSHISAPVTVTATTSATALNPPTALAVTALGPKAVSLTWAPPNDMGLIVGSYNILRASSFAGPYSTLATIPNPALAPATAYSDNSASPSTTYFYAVQAVEASNPVTLSGYSNRAECTTPGLGKAVPPVTSSTMAFDANVLKPNTGQVLGIYYIVPTTGNVELTIYNIVGYPIKNLNPGVAPAGVQVNTTWDGTDKYGKTVASGVYLIEIKSPGFHQIKKVIVVK